MAKNPMGLSLKFRRWKQELSEFVVLWTEDSPGGADSYNAWVRTEAAKQDAGSFPEENW